MAKVIERTPSKDIPNGELMEKIAELEAKIAATPSAAPQAQAIPVREMTIDEAALQTKETLMKGEMVELDIPVNPYGTGEDTYVEIWLNGMKWQLKPGESYTVPKEIAAIYKESYMKSAKASARVKVTGEFK